MKFDYKTSEIGDMNTYDIFEVGGEAIAFAVKWEFVEKIIKALSNEDGNGKGHFLCLIASLIKEAKERGEDIPEHLHLLTRVNPSKSDYEWANKEIKEIEARKNKSNK